MADTFHDRIEAQIKDYTETLADGEDLLIQVVLLNGSSIFPAWFGYHNPSMIVIDGVDGKGNEVRMLAHQESVQILMTKIPRVENVPRKTIGFQVKTEDIDADQSGSEEQS